MPRMLDLFAGRLGWSKAFLARGWDVTAVDLVRPSDIPAGVTFIQGDVMQFGWLPGEGLVLKEIDSIFATETDVGIIQARMNAIQLRLYCEHLQGIAEITAKTASPIELLVAHIVGGYLASDQSVLWDSPKKHAEITKRARAMAETLYNQRFA